MIKAVIFDLFGTLTKGFAYPELDIIKEYNLNVDELAVEKFTCGTKFEDVGYNYVGKIIHSIRFKSMGSYLSSIINGLNLEDTKDTREKIVSIFEKDVKKERIAESVPKVLIDLKSRGIKLAIVSNIPYPLYDLPKKHDFKKYFDAVVYSYEEGMLKPNPKMFEFALSRLGVKKDEVIMVGDNFKADIQGAENVGIKGILLDRNNKHPDYRNRITNLTEIKDLL